MRRFVSGFFAAIILFSSFPASADQIEFILTGEAGNGLLPGNISPPTSSNGSGDEGLAGIIFDTSTNFLCIDIEWGSENGYSDLTGEVTLLHLHGPTESLPPDNFGEVTTNIIINLGDSQNFDPSGTGGGLTDFFFLSNQEAEWLLSGRTYINVHTAMYETGEIRGYLVQVPEPAGGILVCCALIVASCRRQRTCNR